MTIPEDLELDRAIHRAVATIPVDVDAGWRDLQDRTRRSPLRAVVWLAAAAAVLLAVLVPIRLLADHEASLDVGGLPAPEQPSPIGPDASVDLGPVRPIRLLLELPGCSDAGDLASWSASLAPGFGSAVTADRFAATTVADVLATTPMPTDADAACATTLRADDAVAYEVRAADGRRLARSFSIAYPASFVPPVVAGEMHLGSPIGSGQGISGYLTRADGVDLTLAVFGLQETGRLLAFERPTPDASSADLQVASLELLSSLTVDRITESSMPGSLLPTVLPSGFRLCVAEAVTAAFPPAGIGPNATIYCDDSGREIRFIAITESLGAGFGSVPGLSIDANVVAPREPGRRLIGFGVDAPLAVDVPDDLADDDLRAMLDAVPWLDRRVLRPAGGSHDHHDEDLDPLVVGALADLGVHATPVDEGLDRRPGWATFRITLDGGRTVDLQLYPSNLTSDHPGPLLPFPQSNVAVETVGGIDVLIVAQPEPSDRSPTSKPHQAVFRCGGLDWNLTDNAATGTDPPVVDALARDLAGGLSSSLPC